MRLFISKRNSKIGDIPNLSLTPGASCVPDVPCFLGGCYARNSYRRFPVVRKAWDENLEFYSADPNGFFRELEDQLCEIAPERFRLFVGGDYPDEEFYRRMVDICDFLPLTKFLVFTKRYDYDYSFAPDNVKIILSTWPGWPLPTNTNLPWAWLEEDERRPKSDYFVCQGNCTDCGHTCWDVVSPELPVVFPRH